VKLSPLIPKSTTVTEFERARRCAWKINTGNLLSFATDLFISKNAKNGRRFLGLPA
jgi:hypothetical protein